MRKNMTSLKIPKGRGVKGPNIKNSSYLLTLFNKWLILRMSVWLVPKQQTFYLEQMSVREWCSQRGQSLETSWNHTAVQRRFRRVQGGRVCLSAVHLCLSTLLHVRKVGCLWLWVYLKSFMKAASRTFWKVWPPELDPFSDPVLWQNNRCFI